MCGCTQGTCPGNCRCGCEHTPPERLTVRMRHRSPNHRVGQIGTATPSPPGSEHTNPGLMWVDYGEEIVHSHGPSGSTGEWCGPGEYTVLPADPRDARGES